MSDRPTSAPLPVLIIGGGPVGLALAGDLGWRGIPVVLFEQTDGTILQPKMDGVNVRTMEFCRRWGIAQHVHDCPYPKGYPQDMVYLTSFSGYELGREAFVTPSGGGEEQTLGASPEVRARCPQNLFDPILRRFAESFPHVSLRYRSRVTGFREEDDSVAVTFEDPEGSHELRGSYLVGCDGGGSWLRGELGIGMSGSAALTYTTNVIFRCEGLQGLHDKRLGYRHIFIGAEGTWGTCVAIDGRDHWRLSIIGSGEKRKLTEQEIRAAIERALGRPIPYEIVSILPWVRRELIADAYSKGRAFIAGDAAHVMSPTGGFGMNTGIADAVDLSWKLTAVLQGWGGPQLLASYEAERRPVGRRAAREATGNLARTLSPGPNPALLEPTLEGAKLRYELGRRYSATMLREWYKLGIDLGYVYRESPICVPDAEPVPPPPARLSNVSLVRELHKLAIHRAEALPVGEPDELPAEEVMVYRPSAEPGARAPHAWIGEGRSTLDLFGRGYVLLDFGGDGALVGAFCRRAREIGVPLEVAAISDPEIAELYGMPLVLVRPDGHVAWRGRAADAGQVLDRVRGA